MFTDLLSNSKKNKFFEKLFVLFNKLTTIYILAFFVVFFGNKSYCNQEIFLLEYWIYFSYLVDWKWEAFSSHISL